MSTFNPPADIAQITLAKSSDVNAVKAATAIAFGLLPSETKLQRGTVNFAVDTGTANTYVVALDSSITSYTDGLQVVFRPLNDNTGSATINLNSLGAKSIRLTDSEPIQAGDISAGGIIEVRYSTATGFFHLTPNSAIYAHDAVVSATAAASSAVASALSASDSLSYRNTAEGYKNTAVSSAAAAGSSAVASAGSASDALGYRNSAESYKNTAGDSATAASSSAVASALSASDSLSYRNAAEGYKNTAGDSATAASSSATSAAAAYDSFDDRYLGAKTSDPTLDNDGNALLTGALYWNSTSNEMRVYSGSAWLTAYLPATGYLALSGGTMTGDITFNAGQTIAGYLPTTGGTMTGDIVFASGQVFLNWIYKNATYNPALVGDAILADTSGGAFTITLPASPATNDYVAVADYKGTFATNNLTINSNGLNLMGSVQTLILNVNYRNVTLVYSGATQGWVIVL
jgi:hypothetical protein